MFLKIITESIRYATIFLFGSAGETVTEKSGHLNLGTPGVMCIGSMGSMIGANLYFKMCDGNINPFLSVFFPLFFCLLFAGLAGALYSFFAVTLHCNQNVTGLALTTFGGGLLPFVASSLDGETAAGFSAISKPIAHMFDKSFYESNWFTQLFFSYGILVYLGIAVAILIAVFMRKTKTGLFLRTVGENPAAADAAGINVNKYRYITTIVGSAISGVGGMFVTFDCLGGALDTTTIAEYGWLAVSLVIFTMWNTEIGIAGSFLFAFLYIAPGYAAVPAVGKYLIKTIPYVSTIAILILTSIFSKRMGKAPAGLGQSYFREDR